MTMIPCKACRATPWWCYHCLACRKP